MFERPCINDVERMVVCTNTSKLSAYVDPSLCGSSGPQESAYYSWFEHAGRICYHPRFRCTKISSGTHHGLCASFLAVLSMLSQQRPSLVYMFENIRSYKKTRAHAVLVEKQWDVIAAGGDRIQRLWNTLTKTKRGIRLQPETAPRKLGNLRNLLDCSCWQSHWWVVGRNAQRFKRVGCSVFLIVLRMSKLVTI